MNDLIEIIGRLIAILVLKGILENDDKEFILGHISEAEYIGTDNENEGGKS